MLTWLRLRGRDPADRDRLRRVQEEVDQTFSSYPGHLQIDVALDVIACVCAGKLADEYTQLSMASCFFVLASSDGFTKAVNRFTTGGVSF